MSLYKESHVKIKSNDYFLVVCGQINQRCKSESTDSFMKEETSFFF